MLSPDRPDRPAVLLFHGRGLISRLIRWQTRAQYSHAALLLPCGRIVESWQRGGVRIKQLKDWHGVDVFDVPTATDWQLDAACAFATRQVGAGYDWRGVLQFLSRGRTRTDGRWFCSELVFAALASAGVELLARIPAAEVSPGRLSTSPLLVPRRRS